MEERLDEQISSLRVHSFEAFYAAEVDGLYRTLALVLRDADLAHEAIDEAMTRAFQRWEKVRNYANPTGWVYRVGMNWALSRIRRRKREVLQMPEASVTMPPIPDQELIDAVMALPLRFREVVVLRYVLDWFEETTASSLSIPKGTVKSRLHQGVETTTRGSVMTSLEKRIHTGLTDVASRLPPHRSSVTEAMRRGNSMKQRTRINRITSAVAVIGLVVVATLTGWPPIPVGQSFTVAEGGESLEATIGVLSVPVSSETVPDWPGGDMHEGLVARSPDFSLEGFGTEQQLTPGVPTRRAPWHPDFTEVTDTLGVYLGELPDATGSVFAVPGRDCCGLDGLVAAIFDPTPTVCIWVGGGLGNGYVCYDETQVGTDTITVTAPDQTERLVAVWLDVPTDTSVVLLSIDGEPVGWQQPVSKIAAFTLPALGDVRMAAYDTAGNLLLERTVPTPVGAPLQAPATTITGDGS